MRHPTIYAFILAALLPLIVPFASQAGQGLPAELRGPVVGYVLDQNRMQIRPINGILGSSVLGEPLNLPFSVATAAFSPRSDFAIAIPATNDATAYVLGNLGSSSRIEAVEGVIAGVDRVVLNAGGTAAALLASSSRQVQVLRGLPWSPSAGPSLDLSSIEGTITAVAIDSMGANILIGASAEHGALYVGSEEASRPRLIASFGSPTSLALLNGDEDVIVADASVNELSLIRNFASAPESFRIAGESDGISGPTGLRISPDGRTLYVADSTSQTLDVWNFERQSIEATFPLDAHPTQLSPLRGTSVFLLNEPGDHPLLLLDTSNPAVYFVPAGKDQN